MLHRGSAPAPACCMVGLAGLSRPRSIQSHSPHLQEVLSGHAPIARGATRWHAHPANLIFFQLPAPWWMLTTSSGATLLTWIPAERAPQLLGMLVVSCEGAVPQCRGSQPAQQGHCKASCKAAWPPARLSDTRS